MSDTTSEVYEAPFGLPNHLSPSQMNTLLTCGEQYRLERVVRVPSRPMWAGIGGSTVHKVTELLDLDWAWGDTPRPLGPCWECGQKATIRLDGDAVVCADCFPEDAA